MDSATIALVTVFTILFGVGVLLPMLTLLIQTGIEIKENNEKMDRNQEERRKLIERM